MKPARVVSFIKLKKKSQELLEFFLFSREALRFSISCLQNKLLKRSLSFVLFSFLYPILQLQVPSRAETNNLLIHHTHSPMSQKTSSNRQIFIFLFYESLLFDFSPPLFCGIKCIFLGKKSYQSTVALDICIALFHS